MDRTLFYKLLGEQPVPPEIERKIYLASAMLNQRYTWTQNPLVIELCGRGPARLRARDELLGLPVLGVGFATTGPDDWNTCLVLRFLEWISTILPGGIVIIDDADGEYVLAKWMTFVQGKKRVNVARIEEHKRQLQGHRKMAERKRLCAAVDRAGSGKFFASIPVRDYADRPEVQEILEGKPELLDGSLEDVANHLVFPWDTGWLGKP